MLRRIGLPRLLVPELQHRALFQEDYAGPTLRDNLGLPIPRAAEWHAARRTLGPAQAYVPAISAHVPRVSAAPETRII